MRYMQKELTKNTDSNKDTWGKTMKDLYQLGKDTNDDKLIKQAVLGQHILDEKTQLENWADKMNKDSTKPFI